MAVKIYKPTTPGLRGMTGYTFEEITKNTPERAAGRHAHAMPAATLMVAITVRHRGGGNRRFIRTDRFQAR